MFLPQQMLIGGEGKNFIAIKFFDGAPISKDISEWAGV